MSGFHLLNIGIHVLAGTVALLAGLVALVVRKRAGRHTQFGRYFVWLLALVVVTALLGFVLFRSNSFLLMLTLLAGYVGYAGYRTTQLRERRSSGRDMLIAVVALVAGVAYLGWLKQSSGNWSASVVYSTLAALVLVTSYDIIKHLWFHERLKRWWLYEHIYKMVSAYSAILSAFTGTVFPDYKPYSQLGPTVLCLWVMVYFIVRTLRQQRKRKQLSSLTPLP